MSPSQQPYAEINAALRSLAIEQVRRANLKLGERAADEEAKSKANNTLSRGQNAYNQYKKYAKSGSGGGESLTTASREGVTQLGGESPFLSETGQFTVDNSLSLGGESAIPETMAPEAYAGAEGGAESAGGGSGLGGAGYVAAIIYAADQAKKNFGGYEKSGGELKFNENTHNYERIPKNVTETPWDEKTKQQRISDAPATQGPLAPIMSFVEDDTLLGSVNKEVARVEKQVYEPISRFISWLGLDIDNGID